MRPALKSDEELMAALASKDLSALETLYDRYNKVAYSLAYRILGNAGTAEDVVQDAFMSVWRRASSYRPDRASPRTWLMAVVHHRAIDRLRSAAATAGDVPLEEVPDRPSDAPPVWQEVWAGQRGDLVRGALESLPAEQKKSIELAYFSGYTHVEIARLMGVPLGTVKGRLRMGLQKLRALLGGPELGMSST